MAGYSITTKGCKELIASFKRAPDIVVKEVSNFIQRAMAQYRSGIQNNPWTMNSSGGGSPVALVNGGSLRASHEVSVTPWSGSIKPTAWYAPYVHGLDGQLVNKRGVKLRPWLDFVAQDKKSEIEKLEKELDNVIRQL